MALQERISTENAREQIGRIDGGPGRRWRSQGSFHPGAYADEPHRAPARGPRARVRSSTPRITCPRRTTCRVRSSRRLSPPWPDPLDRYGGRRCRSGTRGTHGVRQDRSGDRPRPEASVPRSPASTRCSCTAAWTSGRRSPRRQQRAEVPHHLLDLAEPVRTIHGRSVPGARSSRHRGPGRRGACRCCWSVGPVCTCGRWSTNWCSHRRTPPSARELEREGAALGAERLHQRLRASRPRGGRQDRTRQPPAGRACVGGGGDHRDAGSAVSAQRGMSTIPARLRAAGIRMDAGDPRAPDRRPSVVDVRRGMARGGPWAGGSRVGRLAHLDPRRSGTPSWCDTSTVGLGSTRPGSAPRHERATSRDARWLGSGATHGSVGSKPGRVGRWTSSTTCGVPGACVSELRFSKYQGTGNDFVMVLDLDDEQPLGPEEVVALCHRRTGIGADGVIRSWERSPGRVVLHGLRERGRVLGGDVRERDPMRRRAPARARAAGTRHHGDSTSRRAPG